jgi:hypothetical protein
MALEIQGRRCGDKISLGNSANSGLLAENRESPLDRECVVDPAGLELRTKSLGSGLAAVPQPLALRI